jgi:hypothetical protein
MWSWTKPNAQMSESGQDLTHAVQHYVERETVVTNRRRRRNQETAHRGARVDRPAPSSPDEVAVLAIARGLSA